MSPPPITTISDLSLVIDKATTIELRSPVTKPVQTSFGTCVTGRLCIYCSTTFKAISTLVKSGVTSPHMAQSIGHLLETAILPTLNE